MRRATALAAVGLVLAAIGPSALAAGSLPKLATGAAPGEGPRYAVRPHTIDFTGDGTGFIGRIGNDIYPVVGKRPGFLHWKTWTRERAVGVGTLWGKSCIPDCASSPYYRYAVTVTATRPRNGRFSTMTLHYGTTARRSPTYAVTAATAASTCRRAIRVTRTVSLARSTGLATGSGRALPVPRTPPLGGPWATFLALPGAECQENP